MSDQPTRQEHVSVRAIKNMHQSIKNDVIGILEQHGFQVTRSSRYEDIYKHEFDLEEYDEGNEPSRIIQDIFLKKGETEYFLCIRTLLDVPVDPSLDQAAAICKLSIISTDASFPIGIRKVSIVSDYFKVNSMKSVADQEGSIDDDIYFKALKEAVEDFAEKGMLAFYTKPYINKESSRVVEVRYKEGEESKKAEALILTTHKLKYQDSDQCYITHVYFVTPGFHLDTKGDLYINKTGIYNRLLVLGVASIEDDVMSVLATEKRECFKESYPSRKEPWSPFDHYYNLYMKN